MTPIPNKSCQKGALSQCHSGLTLFVLFVSVWPSGASRLPALSPLNDIDHTRTKTQSPQTNGICERFHKTILQEFYQVAFRKRVYRSVEELQKLLDAWMEKYNTQRTHQGKMCCGRTPMHTFLDSKPIWKEKVEDPNQKEQQLLAS